jgi:hypothetical protein
MLPGQALLRAAVDNNAHAAEAAADCAQQPAPHGYSAAHLAAFFGSLDVLRLLLPSQAQAEDYQGAQPLAAAASAHYSPECARALLAAGAPVNAVSCLGRTPLMEAAHNSHGQTVVALLEAGADALARDAAGLTALHELAAQQDACPRALELLCTRSNVHAREQDRRTAMSVACQRGSAAAVRALSQAGARMSNASPENCARWLTCWAEGSPRGPEREQLRAALEEHLRRAEALEERAPSTRPPFDMGTLPAGEMRALHEEMQRELLLFRRSARKGARKRHGLAAAVARQRLSALWRSCLPGVVAHADAASGRPSPEARRLRREIASLKRCLKAFRTMHIY